MITIYGATGYTGRLIAELLVTRGVEFTIAGRSEARLRDLKTSLTKIAKGGATPEIAPVALDDGRALSKMLERTKVLLTCAGPYAQIGQPLIDACLERGCHYLDITGEVGFMLETAKRDAEAKKKNIALVNAVGMDVVPTDFLAHLAAEKLGGGVERVEVGLAVDGMRVSAGTLRSALGVMAEPTLAYVDGAYVSEPLAKTSRLFQWTDELKDKYGKRTAFSAPLGDMATIPRTTATQNARTYLMMPALAGTGIKLLSPIARLLFKGGPKGIVAAGLPNPGAGPSPEARKRSRFAAVAEAQKGKRVAIAAMTGNDVYGLTAHTAAHALISLCNPAYTRAGALTPMQAIEPGIWRQVLEKCGCQITFLRTER